jgi:hypothetical protein
MAALCGAIASACSSGAGPRAAPDTASSPQGSGATKGEAAMTDALPLCKTGTDMRQHDGREVIVEGMYRKQMTPKKKSRPDDTRFLGYVSLELEGRASDYDEAAWEQARAEVRLGTEPRPAGEVEQFADKRVRARGRLVVQPPGSDEDIAQADPLPTLFEPTNILLAE